MQPTPATSGNHAGVYPSDAQQAASSTSAIPAIPAMPVLRAGTPQQALLQPVRDGDTTAVRKLLANGGVNLNDVDPDTRLMPLMLSSRQGHDDVALVLTRGMQGAHHQASPCRGASASPEARSLLPCPGLTVTTAFVHPTAAHCLLFVPGSPVRH
jgi:hypothetical protein